MDFVNYNSLQSLHNLGMATKKCAQCSSQCASKDGWCRNKQGYCCNDCDKKFLSKSREVVFQMALWRFLNKISLTQSTILSAIRYFHASMTTKGLIPIRIFFKQFPLICISSLKLGLNSTQTFTMCFIPYGSH